MLSSPTTRLTLASIVLATALLWLPAADAADRHAAMVIDANTGAVLHADAADEPRYPASLAKMMTLYLAFEAIERGQMSYSTRIKISQEAASAPPTKLDLDPGEDIALIDAIKALITKSANDMAIAIAEHIAGSEARFAGLMTDKSRLIGMTQTVFKNASGLPDPDQVTSARDMLILALRLQDEFARHYPLFGLRSFSYGGATMRNHNLLLGTFPGTDGIKTGYTRMSGFNLVASVRRGGRHVVGALFGGSSAKSRDATMRLLLTRALMRASPVKTRKPQPMLVAGPQPARRAPAMSRPEPMPAPVPPVPTAAVRRPEPAPTPQLGPVQPRQAAVAMHPAASHPSPPAAAGPGLGAAPSTLDRQAMNLARGAPSLQYAQPVAAQPLAHSAAGGFEIQVGAFASAGEAERALSSTRGTAAGLLEPYAARTIPVQKDSRQLFRARFSGFDANTAASTCLELRRRQIDCLVMKAE